jgi:hypothetical protein
MLYPKEEEGVTAPSGEQPLRQRAGCASPCTSHPSNTRLPTIALQRYPVTVEHDTLSLEQNPLQLIVIGSRPNADPTLRVDNPVPRNFVPLRQRVQRVTDLSRPGVQPRQRRHLSVCCHSSPRDAFDHFINLLVGIRRHVGRIPTHFDKLDILFDYSKTRDYPK